jgi:hypothetical protein
MVRRRFVAALIVALAPMSAPVVHAQLKAVVPTNAKPPWSKGIQAINAENYWNAVECGKQGGARPACVFYDADLCKNEDFVLALFTPYKQVAYQVWQAVQKKQPVPTPSYSAAQRTRVVVGITLAKGTKNAISAVNIKRGGKTIEPVTRTLDGGGGTFIFDFPAFAPTASITIDMVGKTKSHSCAVDRTALSHFR